MKHLQTLQSITNIALVLCISVLLITCYVNQPSCQQVIILNAPDGNRSLHPPAPNMLTCSKGAEMHRKEEEAMVQATLAREMKAMERQLQEEEAAVPVASGVALPLVVSPPSAQTSTPYLLVTSVRKVREPKRIGSPQKPWKRTQPTTPANHQRRRNQRNLK